MTKSSVDELLRLPALATAGCGLENLRNGYRREWPWLEGDLQKKLPLHGHLFANQGFIARQWR
ncbi:hypothetical protein [Pseudomonas sp.]|uniref:hypothetical protein n=1 Tax=Pseudomonas sp. TaxID=306 RepID=UPI0028A66572|nr:hypothetical protein [Pseudomonas sp.]